MLLAALLAVGTPGLAVDTDASLYKEMLPDKWSKWSLVLGCQISQSYPDTFHIPLDVEQVCQGIRTGFALEEASPEPAHIKELLDRAKNESHGLSEEEIAEAQEGFGFSVGREFSSTKRGWQLDIESLCLGIKGGIECKLDDFDDVVEEFRQDYRDYVFRNKLRQSYEKAEHWLQGNAQKETVVVLPSGLQYEVMRKGRFGNAGSEGDADAKKPMAGDQVTLHVRAYTRLMNVFYDSYEKGGPKQYVISEGKVLECWREGLLMMSEGDKYRFYCPARMAYGDNGFPKDIRPGELAIFEIELLTVFPATTADNENSAESAAAVEAEQDSATPTTEEAEQSGQHTEL